MTTSDRLGITELAATQTNRHIVMNEAIAKLEAGAVLFAAKQVLLNTPPGSPAAGDLYIVGTSPTGAWAGKAKQPTFYYNSAWVFLPVFEGMYADDGSTGDLYRYDGSAWTIVIAGGGGAPNSADYLVKTANGGLSAERVVKDSASLIWDWGTAGEAKATVVGASGSSDFKESVVVATTANITLSGEQTIDGVLTSASRVLVKNQTAAADNGIYDSAAGAWSRSSDADTSAEVTAGMQVYVDSGTVNSDQIFALITPDPITLGTTALTFWPVVAPKGFFANKNVTASSYTLIASDSGKRINRNNASANDTTVPPNSSVAFAINTEIEICQIGAGQSTIVAGSGVTINSPYGLVIDARYGIVRLKKRGTNVWELSGDALPAVRRDATANLTAGYTATAFNAGTKSTGTFTPDPANGNIQRAVNGGAHTLAPPSVGSGDALSMVIQYTNNSSAGAITTTGFTKVSGDTLTTVDGHDFLFYISVVNGFSHLNVVALQ